HPTIDACIQLRNRHRLVPGRIAGIETEVHPLVLELTGKTSPQVGLEGKVSVYHCAAVAVIDGPLGDAQFSAERGHPPGAVARRARVVASIDPKLREDAAHVRIRLTDGSVVEQRIEHAIGSLERPMSDADLEAKLRGLCTPILDTPRIDALIDACWRLDAMKQAGDLGPMTAPKSARTAKARDRAA